MMKIRLRTQAQMSLPTRIPRLTRTRVMNQVHHQAVEGDGPARRLDHIVREQPAEGGRRSEVHSGHGKGARVGAAAAAAARGDGGGAHQFLTMKVLM